MGNVEVKGNITQYYPGKITELTDLDSGKSKFYFWIMTILSFVAYIGGFGVYIFGATIMVLRGLREEFWPWGIVAVASTLLVFRLSRYIKTNFGAKKMINRKDKFAFVTYFGNVTKIPKEEIFAVDIIESKSLLSVFGKKPSNIISITSAGTNYKFNAGHFQNSEEIVEFFTEIADQLSDEFFGVFEREHENRFLNRLLRDKFAIVGLGIIVIYTIIFIWGVLGNLLYPPNAIYGGALGLKNPGIRYSFLEDYDVNSIVWVSPNSQFWFGTDHIGRDLFARLVYGTVYTLGIAFGAAIILILLIVFFGYSTAIIGGWYDDIIMRIGDTFLTFPPFIPVILIASLAGPITPDFEGAYYFIVFGGLSLLTWPSGARVLRAETLKILKSDYVKASEVLGASRAKIVFDHVLPKTIPTVVFQFVYAVGDVIIGITMLGLIGLGGPNSITWGSDLEKAISLSENVFNQWWVIVFPTIWIAGIILGLTLLSDAIRDNFDIEGF